MTYNELLDDLLIDLGGCGVYQIFLGTMIHLMKLIATWSMLTMSFAGQTPGFQCVLRVNENWTDVQTGNISIEGKCDVDGMACNEHVYDDNHMKTVVSEFDLVCDRKWIPASITSIQMGGLFLGCYLSGHLADSIGRKPTYFMGILLMVLSNLAGYVSPTWIVYAAMRFLIGVGVAFILTVQYSITNEFTTSKWRPAVVTTPSWSIQSGLFALLAWILRDWQKVHLAIVIVGALFLLAWWVVPESFRWLVTKQRFNDAKKVIGVVARINRKEKPDLTKLFKAATDSQESAQESSIKKHYSAFDLFRTKSSAKITIGVMFAWFSASYGFYGITFGVKNLSGDLYMNMFLINTIETPFLVLTGGLVRWFGRKKVTSGFYILAGITGIAVGVIQHTDAQINGQITNIIALVAKLSVGCGWQAMIVYTTELYPTVIRTIANGVHNASARVGGIVAPQIVFLDDDIPGIMYFMSGVLMMASAVIMMLFRETKDVVLCDTMEDDVEMSDKHKHESSIMITKL